MKLGWSLLLCTLALTACGALPASGGEPADSRLLPGRAP